MNRASRGTQLALWSAANLAGMETPILVTREPFFRRLMNRVGGKRRRRVIRVRRPAARAALPMLAQAVLGTTRATLHEVFGPPRGAAFDGPPPCAVASYWDADTWYYPLPRNGNTAMAIGFDEAHACRVEFFDAPANGA